MTDVPAAGTSSLTVRDNRTGQEYDVPIVDGAIKAADVGAIRTEDGDSGLAVYDPGFVNTASCRSSVTFIDGEKGILEYRGYPIEQLAEKSSFLEVAYLLINGALPTREQYDEWVHHITYHTFVHENVKGFMQGFRYDAHPMGMLMASVGALSTFYPDARNISDAHSREIQIIRMIAKMPTLGAWAFRHAQGKPYVYPDNDLGYTANFLCTPTTSRTARPTRFARWAPARSTPTPRSPRVSPPCSAPCTAAPTRPCCGCCAGSARSTTSPPSSRASRTATSG